MSAYHLSVKVATRILEAAITLVLLLCVLVGGALLTLRYAVLPNAEQLTPWLEQAGSRAVGLPVHIGGVQSTWHGLLPIFTLQDVVLDDMHGRPALRLGSVQAMPSWKSLPRLQLSFEQLVIRNANLQITRVDPQHLEIGGIRVALSGSAAGNQPFADWLFEQDQILVLDSSITWLDAARAQPPLTLRNVDLELRNTVLHHRAALRATPPPDLGAAFSLRADLRQPLFSRHHADFAQWHGTLWTDLPRVDLRRLAQVIPLPAQTAEGRGAVRAWLDVRPGYHLARLTAACALRDVQAKLDPALPPLALRDLQGRLVWRPLPGGVDLQLAGLQFTTTAGEHLPPVDLRLSLQQPKAGTTEGLVQTGRVDLGLLTQVAQRLPLPGNWHERLAQLAPRGQLTALRAQWRQASPGTRQSQPLSYAVHAEFTGLGWNPPDGSDAALPAGLPGLHGLSGTIDADQNQGQAQLKMRNATLAWPSLFEARSLPVQQMDTRLSWNRHQDGTWSVQTAALQLATPDAAGTASLRYTSALQGPGSLDLTARLNRADARAVSTYLPLGIPQDTRAYLRSAIAAGSSRDVRFEVHGPLQDFPFSRPGSGVFSVTARIEGGAFNIAPRQILPPGQRADIASAGSNATWPLFTDIDGVLQFTGRGMQARDASARIGDTRVQQVRLDLPDYEHPVLQASGQARASAGDALRYVRTSPLQDTVGEAFSRTTASGPLALDLKLRLPLDNLDRSTVQGHLQLQGVQMSYFPELPPLSGIKGDVAFTEKDFKLQVTAQNFLGGPLQLEGGQAQGGMLNLQGDGTFTTAALQGAPQLRDWQSLLRHASGRARYQVDISGDGVNRPPRVQLRSNLAGIAIELPPPLGKAAAAGDPLRFTQSPGSTPGQTVWDIDLGGDLRARLLRAPAPEAPQGPSQLQGGAVALGPQAALPAAGPAGMQVNVNLPLLDLDAWQRALGGDSAQGPALMPDALSLRVGKLVVSDRVFNNIVLGATRSGNTWQANLDSSQLAGYVAWQMGRGDAPGSLSARLSRLSLPDSADPEVERLLDHPPRNLPALNVLADNVDLHGHHFDHLKLQAQNRGLGAQRRWLLDNFTLASPEAVVTGSGDWVPGDAGAGQAHRMSIGFKLQLDDAGALLARLGKPGLLQGGKGVLQGTLSWLGSPLALDYPTLSGQFNLALGRGRFLRADPGIAKLLGVLSLQSLPRRLLLNFSDVFEKGFAFDKVGADVELQNGVATTHNFKMSGVAATVFIDGAANLAHETQDLYVVVVPEINAGSASLAYALVNPAVGLGTFLAQLIAREPLMKALTYGYRVTGTWAQPVVRERGAPSTSPPEHGATAPAAP